MAVIVGVVCVCSTINSICPMVLIYVLYVAVAVAHS
jgi:hypothetical protein